MRVLLVEDDADLSRQLKAALGDAAIERTALILVGPALAAESYLVGERIIEAAVQGMLPRNTLA